MPSPLNSKPDFCSNQAHNSDGKEHLISENAFFCYLMKLGWPPPLREGLNWCKLDYLTTHPDKDRHYNHFLHPHHHPPPLNFLKALKINYLVNFTCPLPFPYLPSLHPLLTLLCPPPSISCPSLVPISSLSCPYLVPVLSLNCYPSPPETWSSTLKPWVLYNYIVGMVHKSCGILIFYKLKTSAVSNSAKRAWANDPMNTNIQAHKKPAPWTA